MRTLSALISGFTNYAVATNILT
uniref:Uncharacterized protein n=1 Tax=Arundo donax TaxID=35708 RepID=A0A0A9ERY0_ARUDO